MRERERVRERGRGREREEKRVKPTPPPPPLFPAAAAKAPHTVSMSDAAVVSSHERVMVVSLSFRMLTPAAWPAARTWCREGGEGGGWRVEGGGEGGGEGGEEDLVDRGARRRVHGDGVEVGLAALERGRTAELRQAGEEDLGAGGERVERVGGG